MERYECPNVPVIINGAADDWAAQETWNFANFYKEYKEAKLWVGEDDEGYALRMKMGSFLEYLVYNRDDSPLYLFESSI